MARVDTSDATFCVVDDETMWGRNLGYPMLVKLLKLLRKTVDPTVFKVWVVQDGRVTHIVPYAAFCEVAGV